MGLENSSEKEILSFEEIHALPREEQDKLYEEKYFQARRLYDVWKDSKLNELRGFFGNFFKRVYE
jgi:hypothetical protein